MKKMLVALSIFTLLLANSVPFPGLTPGRALAAGEEIPGPTYTGTLYGEELRQNCDFADTVDHWARRAIVRMSAQSVVRGYGSSYFAPQAPVTRAEALAMLVRSLGQEAAAQRAAEQPQKPKPGTTQPAPPAGPLAFWARGYLQVALDNGIITADEKDNTAWDMPAQRQEAAVWLAKALGLSPVYGDAQQAIFNFRDWDQADPRALPYIESVLQQKIMSGLTPSTFAPAGTLTRAEMVTMLDNTGGRLLSKRGIAAYSGKVVDIRTAQASDAQGFKQTTLYCVINADGQGAKLASERQWLNSGGVVTKEMVVYKDGQVGTSSLLELGDTIEYLVKNGQDVLYVEVRVPDQSTVSGTVESLDGAGKQIVIRSASGQPAAYALAENVPVTIGERPGELADLLYGQEVELSVENGLVTAIRGMLPADGGGTPAHNRVRQGRVRNIDSDQLTIVLPDGHEETYEVGSFTAVTRGGKATTLDQVRTGDQVRLYLQETVPDAVTKIEIAGPSQLVQAIYKGKITSVLPRTGEVIIQDAQAYIDGEWVDTASPHRLTLAGGAGIYAGGALITPENLKQNHLNHAAYFVVENSFGQEQAVKVLVKDGSELVYRGRITDLSWGRSTFDLADRTLHFHPGTIVVQNQRLTDTNDLQEDNSVLAVATRQGDVYTAALIISDDFTLPEQKIYAGIIRDVGSEDFTIDNYRILQDNNWGAEESSEEPIMVEDGTFILDATGDTPHSITPEEFLYSRFTHAYRYDHVYLIADGNRAVAMTILPDSLDHPLVSTARIASVDRTAEKITLDHLNDWSEFREQWTPNSASLALDLSRSIIIKDGEPAGFASLRAGDRLYLIRDALQAVVVIVQ